MRRNWGFGVVVAVAAAGCSGSDPPTTTADAGVADARFIDTGSLDTGIDVGSPDIGATDIGNDTVAVDIGGDGGVGDVGTADTGADVPTPIDVSVVDVVVTPSDAGGLVLRRGSLGTLGPRPPRSVAGRIVDDEIQSGGRMCAGSVCVTGGFLR